MGIISDLKDVLNPVSGVTDIIFGKGKGIASSIVDTLKSAGVIKDPEAEQRAMQALNDYDIKKREIENRSEEIVNEKLKIVNDAVKDARNMQIEALKQTDIFSKRFIYYLTSFIIIFSCTYIMLITFIEIPEKNVRYADTILGFMLGTLLTTVIVFHYGSSAGSVSKNETNKMVLEKLLTTTGEDEK